MNKLENLIEFLKTFPTLAVAYSAGVDSTFLLYAAKKALGENCAAFMAVMDFVPEKEIKAAEDFCKREGIKLYIEKIDILSEKDITDNPVNRCYLCKKKIMGAIISKARSIGFSTLMEGSNLDDTKDYRPGMEAVKELGIKSPLLELGFTKKDIRYYSKLEGLPTADKPSFACLASRFPYGQSIGYKELAMVEMAEDFLCSKGFMQYRVRIEGLKARIELLPEDIEKAASMPLRKEILMFLTNLGFKGVSLDLQGFRSGSMNPQQKNIMENPGHN